MHNKLKQTISKLKKLKYVDKKTVNEFLNRLKADTSITDKENPTDHFCSFFVPVYLPTLEIFAGHHIKADEWIPPGGHMKTNETTIDTVSREFYEELNHRLTNEKIVLFDIGITPITNNLRNRKCRIHRDFWYYVIVDKVPFAYDKREFYDAAWLPIDTAIKRAYRSEVISHLVNLKKILRRSKTS